MTQIVTPVYRGSYVFLTKTNKYDKYAITLMVPKDAAGNKQIKDWKAIIKTHMDDKFPKGWPNNFHQPISDGDEDNDPNFDGHWLVRFSSPHKPQVVDNRVQIIIDPSEIYSGAWYRVSASAFAFDNMAKGVSFGLNNVQKCKDDEHMDGRTTAAQDFGVFDDPNAATDDEW